MAGGGGRFVFDPTRIKRRSQARMLALQALCVLDAVGDDFQARLDAFLSDEAVLADLGIETPPPEDLLPFAHRLATRAWSDRALLDERLGRIAARWTVARMPPVDRNILRMALCELRDADPERPGQLIVGEAVDLARRFGDTDSPAFVNGVLDAARKDLEQTSDATNPHV